MVRGKERRAVTLALVESVREFLAQQVIVNNVDDARRRANLRLAFSKYEELHPTSPAPEDANLWPCPHCDGERPGFGWQLNQGSYPDYDLQVLTCFCKECRTLFTVNVVGCSAA